MEFPRSCDHAGLVLDEVHPPVVDHVHVCSLDYTESSAGLVTGRESVYRVGNHPLRVFPQSCDSRRTSYRLFSGERLVLVSVFVLETAGTTETTETTFGL
jgi:hypothetical protein